MALSIIPALILGAELALRLAGFGYDTAYFQRIDGADAYTRNLKYGWRFFPRSMATTPEVFRVPVEKPAGTFRVFVMGGSAALGTPDAAFGVSRVLQAMLDELYPEGSVEVVNTAMAAINSHVVLQIASECAELDPDLFVVYLGNNEVIGPFGAGTIFAGYSASRSSIRTGLWLKTTRLGQLYEVFAPEHGDFEVWRGMEMFSEHHVPADDPRLERVYAHFRANLEDVCDLGLDAGAEVVLCTVGTNLRDNPPFGSRHGTGLAPGDEEAWTDLYERGVALEEAGELDGALRLYGSAAELDDRFADLWFRTARCLLALGRADEAKEAYVRARDLDTLRFRADSRINAILREVGAERGDEGVRLVDAERAFEADAPDGIPGFEHFWEHVHLSFPGNWRLAATVLPRIEASLPAELRAQRRGDVPVPSLADVAERLVFTRRDEADQTETILGMVKRPPFIGQLDHELHRAALARRLKELRANKKAALVDAWTRYSAAVEQHPGDWHLLFGLAGIDMQRGAPDEAAKLYERLVQMFPHEISYRQSYSRALFAAGRDEDALGQLEVAREIDPGNPDVNTLLGNYLAREGESEQALEYYLVALERRPGVRAHTYAGDVLFENGRYDEAREHFERALQVDPDFAPAMTHLALLIVEQSADGGADLSRAVELAERACEVTDFEVLEHVQALAAVLREAGEPKRMAEVFEHAARVAEADGRDADVAELARMRAGVDVELERKRRARRASTLIRRLGAELGMSADAIRELTSLPLAERQRALDDLGRRVVVQRVAEQGLPSGLTRAEWEAWADLPDEEFFARAAAAGLLPGAQPAGGD